MERRRFLGWLGLGWLTSILAGACGNRTQATGGGSSAITVAELSKNGFLQRRVQGTQVLLTQDADDPSVIYAVEPVCTHRQCNVSWRRAEGNIFCSCHGSIFSPRGEVLQGPAVRPLNSYEVEVEDGVIAVSI